MGNRLDTIRAGIPAFAYFYTVGSIGFWLPLYAKNLGWPYLYVTLLSTVYFIAVTPSTVLAGALADLTGKPNIILSTGMALNALTSALMAHIEDPPSMLIVRTVQGISLSVSIPLALGSLSLMHGVARGVAFTAVFSGAGMAAGAAVSGILINYHGFQPLFYSTAAISMLAAIASLTWSLPVSLKRTEGFLEALKKVKPGVFIFMVALVMRNFFASGVFSIISIVFARLIGLNPIATGIALSVNPLIQSLWSSMIYRIVRDKEAILYSLGILGGALVFKLYLIADNLPIALAAQALLGISYGTIVVSGNSYIIGKSPERIRYTASSFYGFAFNLGWILGTIIAGPYMDLYGPREWVHLASIGLVFTSIIPLSTLLFNNKASTT